PALHAAGLRTIAPDQRGYSPGARPAGVEAYSMHRVVADALGLLDAYGLARAHVVGHDWGAAVGWNLAGRHPDRVATLTAISVPHPAADARRLRVMLGPVPADDFVRPLTEPGALTGPLNWYRAMSRRDLDGLGPVTVPTTYVW